MDVLDAAGNPIADLRQEDVTVVEGDLQGRVKSFRGPASQAVNVILVIDVSGSMAQQGRIAGAHRAAHAALDALKNDRDRLGLIAFDDHFEFRQPFSTITAESRSECARQIDRLRPRSGTFIGPPIIAALRTFADKKPDGLKLVLLMTDGDDNERDRFARLREQIGDLSDQLGVQVHAISVGDEVSQGGEDDLKDLAAKGKGRYEHSPQAERLAELFRSRIAETVNECTLVYDSPYPTADGFDRPVTVSIRTPAGPLTATASYKVGPLFERPLEAGGVGSGSADRWRHGADDSAANRRWFARSALRRPAHWLAGRARHSEFSQEGSSRRSAADRCRAERAASDPSTAAPAANWRARCRAIGHGDDAGAALYTAAAAKCRDSETDCRQRAQATTAPAAKERVRPTAMTLRISNLAVRFVVCAVCVSCSQSRCIASSPSAPVEEIARSYVTDKSAAERLKVRRDLLEAALNGPRTRNPPRDDAALRNLQSSASEFRTACAAAEREWLGARADLWSAELARYDRSVEHRDSGALAATLHWSEKIGWWGGPVAVILLLVLLLHDFRHSLRRALGAYAALAVVLLLGMLGIGTAMGMSIMLREPTTAPLDKVDPPQERFEAAIAQAIRERATLKSEVDQLEHDLEFDSRSPGDSEIRRASRELAECAALHAFLVRSRRADIEAAADLTAKWLASADDAMTSRVLRAGTGVGILALAAVGAWIRTRAIGRQRRRRAGTCPACCQRSASARRSAERRRALQCDDVRLRLIDDALFVAAAAGGRARPAALRQDAPDRRGRAGTHGRVLLDPRQHDALGADDGHRTNWRRDLGRAPAARADVPGYAADAAGRARPRSARPDRICWSPSARAHRPRRASEPPTATCWRSMPRSRSNCNGNG